MSTLSNPTAEALRSAPFGAPMAKSLPAGPRTVAPMHPGEIIGDLLDDNRMSHRAAAKAIGMSPTGLMKVLKGQSPVTAETALRIDALFGGNGPELWLNLQAAYDLWKARERIEAQLAEIKPLPNSYPAPKKRAG